MVLPIIIFVVLNTAGLLLLKSSLSGNFNLGWETLKSLISSWRFTAGFIAYAASFLTWLYILSKKDIVYAYPIVVGLGYAAVVVASVVFLRESLTPYRIIGIVLIGLGLLFMTR